MYMAVFFRWADINDLSASLERHLPQAVIFATVFSFMMFALGLYNKEYVRDMGDVLTRILVSFILGIPVLALLFYLIPDVVIWRSALAIAFVVAVIGLMCVRWCYLKIADMNALKRRVLVIGAGKRAAKLAELEASPRSTGFKCVGFLPLGRADPAVEESATLPLGTNTTDFVVENDVEEIVVAVDERRGGIPMDDLLECRLQGISVTEYSDFWERETGKMDLDALHPSWLIYSDGFIGGWFQVASKRIFDLAASAVLLVASFPVLVVTAFLVKITSKGSVFYRQERVGFYGKPFVLYKFRSMRTDAEEDGIPKWADENDARITAIGGFIRKTRIDEIPQIFNVLKGEMSFIGPRPERPYFVKELSKKIPYYFERHRVKPGISGWAQLNYPYGASIEDAREKFQYDLYYIKNYSLFLDFIILVQTIRVILWPRGVR